MLDPQALISEVQRLRSLHNFQASGALQLYLDALGYEVLSVGAEILLVPPNATSEAIVEIDNKIEKLSESLIQLKTVLPPIPVSIQAIEPEVAKPSKPCIDDLLEQRRQARLAKDWKRADEIRDAIAGMGYQVIDAADGRQRLNAKG